MRIIGFIRDDYYVEISNDGLPKLVLDCEYNLFKKLVIANVLHEEVDELVIKKGVLVGIKISKYYWGEDDE